jgi:hypothetical protein
MPPDFNDKKQEAPKHGATRDLESEIDQLRSELAAARGALPLTLVPEHGAGPGMAINPTWSQAEQEAAAAKEALDVGPNPI